MFSSTHQKMISALIVLTCAVFAQAQSAAKEPASTISGKVTIKDKPLAGVVINLRNNRFSPDDRLISYKARTDANGEYRIANVAAGNYVIMPLAPAFVSETDGQQGRKLIVNKGETIEHIDFSLLRGGAITGKVVDADSRPVVEERVSIFNAQTNERIYFPGAQVSTDDRGVYRVYGLRAGSYKVAAGEGDEGGYGGRRPATFKRAYYPSTPDAAQATVIELSEGGEATSIDIMLGRSVSTYSASGRIVDAETGQPLPNVGYGVVHYINPNSSSSRSNGAVSNSRGEFRLENLVPGKYAVQIGQQPGSNWRAEDLPFEIVDDDVTGLVVQTRKGASLSGVVIIEGTVDKGARDDLRHTMLTATSERENGATSSWSMIGADGGFSMTGVAAGTAVFRVGNSSRFSVARVERNGVVQGRGVEVREGETIGDLRVFLAYGNASIRGVIEVTNGTLPPGSRFYIWLRNAGDDPTMGIANGPVEVDARGQFLIDGLMPGTYEVNAGVVNEQTHALLGSKKQQVVVSGGPVNNVTIAVELNPSPARP